MLAIADTHQIRARQLPLALDFLRDTVGTLTLSRPVAERQPVTRSTFAVDIERGARPERAASLLVGDASALRLFDVDALLERIDRQIGRVRTARGATFGIDVLERQTLGRLRTALAGKRARRAARTVVNLRQPALFGHREITTRLLFDPTRAGADADVVAAGWTLLNRSAQGACLTRPDCLPGTVQVGELVALSGLDPRRGPVTGRAAALLGSVRWVRSDGAAGITLGIEYLARGVMVVSVVPSEAEAPIAEHALIIACKMQQSIVRTILLPPYLYEVGERLTATQGKRSRQLELKARLQTNGLFGHFLLG